MILLCDNNFQAPAVHIKETAPEEKKTLIVAKYS